MGNHPHLTSEEKVQKCCSELRDVESVWPKVKQLLNCEVYMATGANCFSLILCLLSHTSVYV